MFEGLKARLEKLLADHTPPGDPRARIAALHAALLETRVAVGVMREGLEKTERALSIEQRQLEDAERRGRLAAQVPDAETVTVAEQFATRHRERIAVLEKKRTAQREELQLAERDLEQLGTEYRGARQGTDPGRTAAQEGAWRDIEAAGGVRPETDLEGEILKRQMQQRQMDQVVDAQLEHLKKKMKKD